MITQKLKTNLLVSQISEERYILILCVLRKYWGKLMYGKSNCSVCFPNKKDNSIVFRHAVLKPPTKSDRDLLSKGLDSELSFLSFFLFGYCLYSFLFNNYIAFNSGWTLKIDGILKYRMGTRFYHTT